RDWPRTASLTLPTVSGGRPPIGVQLTTASMISLSPSHRDASTRVPWRSLALHGRLGRSKKYCGATVRSWSATEWPAGVASALKLDRIVILKVGLLGSTALPIAGSTTGGG